MKYKISLEGKNIIQYIEIPILVVHNGSYSNNSMASIVIGDSEYEHDERHEVTVLKHEVNEWISKNIHGGCFVIGLDILFELEEEAVWFKTVWL